MERIVIAELMILKQEERIDAIIELDKEGIFLEHKYQSLFNTIRELTLKNIEPDVVTVFQTNQNIGAGELSKLCSEVYTAAFIKDHITSLKSRKFKREILKTIKEHQSIIESGSYGEDIDSIKNGLITSLSGTEFESKSHFIDFGQEDEKLSQQLNSGNKIEGFSWGISDLDKWTSGIIIPRVYALGALKKAGKTRFLIHTAVNLYNQGVPSAFISLEAPAYEVNKLFKAAYFGIDDLKLRSNGWLSKEEKEKILSFTIDSTLFGVEVKAGLDKNQALTRIRRYAKMGYKVIFIDYLQRIRRPRKNDASELEAIANDLADAARENNVALIELAQLNNVAEHEKPTMGHFKGSGGIGESVDTAILFDNIYRRKKDEKRKGEVDLIIEQRYSDSGELTIHADLGKCKFNNFIRK